MSASMSSSFARIRRSACWATSRPRCTRSASNRTSGPPRKSDRSITSMSSFNCRATPRSWLAWMRRDWTSSACCTWMYESPAASAARWASSAESATAAISMMSVSSAAEASMLSTPSASSPSSSRAASWTVSDIVMKIAVLTSRWGLGTGELLKMSSLSVTMLICATERYREG